MYKVSALQIRQGFGKILKKLQQINDPILIEKGRLPVAVLISLKTFKERFIDYADQKKKEDLLKRFEACATPGKEDSLQVLRELRYGPNR